MIRHIPPYETVSRLASRSWMRLGGLNRRLWVHLGAGLTLAVLGLTARGADVGSPGTRDDRTLLENRLAQVVSLGDKVGEANVRVQLAASFQRSGHFCAATEQVEQAARIASTLTNAALQLEVLVAGGFVDLAARRLEAAEAQFRRALTLADGIGNEASRSLILTGLGTESALKTPLRVEAAVNGNRGMVPLKPRPASATPTPALLEARRLFSQALETARAASDPLLEVRVQIAQSAVELRLGDAAMSQSLAMAIHRRLEPLSDSTARRDLEVVLIRLLAEIQQQANPADAAELQSLTLGLCARILDNSGIGSFDGLGSTYATGVRAAMWARQGRLDEALQATLRALELAQSGGIDEATFEWTWQAARILRRQGSLPRAAAAYDLAIELLKPLRSDFLSSLASGVGGGVSRESINEVYAERADLLLLQARTSTDPSQRQEMLGAARKLIERMRASELEDYFLDEECAGRFVEEASSLREIGDTTAVLYVLTLPDRTELLVQMGMELVSVSSPVTSVELRRGAAELRQRLSGPLAPATEAVCRQFWTWLIEPVEASLKRRGIKTLVFVPDRQVASIPPAAFLGPNGYLVEQYALATSPGLSQMRAGRFGAGRARPLLCGVSQGAEGFTPLAGVREELESIRNLTRDARVLLDEAFTTNTFSEALTDERHQWVHVASHAYFGGDASRTYLLAGKEQKVTLDALEQMLLPRMLSRKPIELLVLSACETAVGDERAAFGLAGLAVKSGVRTAIASLWQVEDQSTRQLMVNLYRELQEHPGISRAEALQRAQKQMLVNPGTRHPRHWSPFILMGQWEDSKTAARQSRSRR